uniref:Uncharacterized protein n=1 Tax=Glossina austeni TaxID=7395 RepID=A0A1A9UD95_GLOAU
MRRPQQNQQQQRQRHADNMPRPNTTSLIVRTHRSYTAGFGTDGAYEPPSVPTGRRTRFANSNVRQSGKCTMRTTRNDTRQQEPDATPDGTTPVSKQLSVTQQQAITETNIQVSPASLRMPTHTNVNIFTPLQQDNNHNDNITTTTVNSTTTTVTTSPTSRLLPMLQRHYAQRNANNNLNCCSTVGTSEISLRMFKIQASLLVYAQDNSMHCKMKRICGLASCSKYHSRLSYEESHKSMINDSANSVSDDSNIDGNVVKTIVKNDFLKHLPAYIKSPVSSKSVADFLDLRGLVDILCLRWIVSKKSIKKSKVANLEMNTLPQIVIAMPHRNLLTSLEVHKLVESLSIYETSLGSTLFGSDEVHLEALVCRINIGDFQIFEE